MNVTDAIRHHARMRPYDLAVIHPAGTATYLQLAAMVSAVALRLRTHGLGRGKTLAIYVSDPIVHLAVSLAATLNGTATVSAHPNNDPIPAALKIDAHVADRNLPFTPASPVIPVGPNWLQAEEGSGAQPLLVGEGFAGPDSLCRFVTSSGTTGVPKVIGHTVGQVEGMLTFGLSLEPLNHGPNLSMMWFSTIGGMGTANSTLWHGCPLVLATAPLAVLRSINLYKVASLRASPQQLQSLVDMVKGRAVRFPSLQRIEVGGASTPASLVLAARALICPNVVGVYGSTEAGLVSQTPAALLHAQPDAAGYVVPGVTVRIADDKGQAVAAGVEGVVQIRTPFMIGGYIGDDEASAASFRDGWFIPGDLGILGADGVLRITGRTDEMINAGGVKLSPALVDDFLLAQPGVKDAAAFAFRQTGRADEVWAAIVPGESFDEAALLAAGRARLHSRAPVRLIQLEEIPRNAMGKAMRQKLSQDALMQ